MELRPKPIQRWWKARRKDKRLTQFVGENIIVVSKLLVPCTLYMPMVTLWCKTLHTTHFSKHENFSTTEKLLSVCPKSHRASYLIDIPFSVCRDGNCSFAGVRVFIFEESTSNVWYRTQGEFSPRAGTRSELLCFNDAWALLEILLVGKTATTLLRLGLNHLNSLPLISLTDVKPFLYPEESVENNGQGNQCRTSYRLSKTKSSRKTEVAENSLEKKVFLCRGEVYFFWTERDAVHIDFCSWSEGNPRESIPPEVLSTSVLQGAVWIEPTSFGA